MNRQDARIGIDLGGTKIEVLVMDAHGNELFRKREATPQGDYRNTVETVVSLVQQAEAETSMQCSVGVAIPGAVSLNSGRIKNANSTCLNGQDLKADLSTKLSRECRLSNDANCFTLSEAIDGVAAGAESVFGVILGTGTGGGIVIHNQIVTGCNAIAGEWGHNPLPWPQEDELPGPDCYCGQRGCIETFLSGPGMQADHFRHTNEQKTPQQIVDNLEIDTGCAATLARYERRLARALAHVMNILDPEMIVLGGGLSNISRLYENIPLLWPEYVFSDEVKTILSPPMYGDSSGVRGAAWLWPVA